MASVGRMWLTRREFLKTGVAGGATVLVSRLAPFGAGSRDPQATQAATIGAPGAWSGTPGAWSGTPGEARYRIDGIAKVTGQKIYARDFLPADMPGWPAQHYLALVLCSTFVDRIFAGIDLDVLPRGARPQVVITAADLARDEIGVAAPEYPAGKYLVERGTRPDYYGKPVGILLFADRAAFAEARKILFHRGKGIRAGEKVDVPPPSDYPDTSILHVAGERDDQRFARTITDLADETGARSPEAQAYVDRITELLESERWDLYARTYHTPVMDPMFMEPESGLAWFDRERRTVELLIGTQSPGYDVAAVKAILAPSKLGVADTHLYAAYPGGGFGGRDTSILCLYLGLAAAYADRPVRIVNDRFQQFAQGIKRHASTIELEIAVDDGGRFQAVRNRTVLNGGGRINVSSYVGDTAGITGAGAYRFAWADIWSRPQHTQAVVAGSMRGFGSMQASFALESLVDEIAHERGIDPIELRLRNVLDPKEPLVTGVPAAPPGMKEMLEKARAHPLWTERDRRREEARSSARAYGVGFALAIKSYGTGADAVNAAVSIEPDGQVRLTTSAVDMGQGLATALAVSTAGALGRNADEIDTGQVAAFDALQLVGSFDMQPDNPRWTPIVQNATKASSGSSRWVHAVDQASRVLLAVSVLPAAKTIWGQDASALDTRDVRWAEERLVVDGFAPLPLAEIARVMHDRRIVVAAMVHAFFSARWISAEYAVDGVTQRREIDGLAVRRGQRTQWELVDRRNPDLFTVQSMYESAGQTMAATAALVAVEVERRTGEPRVVQGVHLAAPGRMVVPVLVEGQMEGSWAMGVGHALLEELPAFAGSGATGTWNLNRYHVALARDCAIGATEKIILPPESPDAPARGMGEAPLNCVPPAIASAIFHATGRRFRELPITAARIRGQALGKK